MLAEIFPNLIGGQFSKIKKNKYLKLNKDSLVKDISRSLETNIYEISASDTRNLIAKIDGHHTQKTANIVINVFTIIII